MALFFYLFFMPVFSFVFGVFAGNGRKRWLIPFLAGFLAAFVYIFMGNGGFSVSAGDLKSALELSGPSLIAALAGVMVRAFAGLFA